MKNEVDEVYRFMLVGHRSLLAGLGEGLNPGRDISERALQSKMQPLDVAVHS